MPGDLANASTPGYKPEVIAQSSFGDVLNSAGASGHAARPASATAATVAQDLDRPDAGPAEADRRAAGRRAARPRLPRGADAAGHALHPRRAARRRRPGPLVTADGRARARPGREDDPVGSHSGDLTIATDGTITAARKSARHARRRLASQPRQGRRQPCSPARRARSPPAPPSHQGSLEGSGVNPTTVMIDMIVSLRAYESSQKRHPLDRRDAQQGHRQRRGGERLMPDGIYAAAAGMAAQQTRIDYLSNDLANVNTTGYKSQRARVPRPRLHPEQGMPVGAGSAVVEPRPHQAAGAIQPSDNPLSLALGGPGFFQVSAPTARSRSRATAASASTRTATSSPRPASGSSRRSACRRARSRADVSIGADGTVSVGGEDDRQDHARRRPVRRPGCVPLGDNLFAPTAAQRRRTPSPDARSSRASSRLERRPRDDDVGPDRRAAQLRAREPRDPDPGPDHPGRQPASAQMSSILPTSRPAPAIAAVDAGAASRPTSARPARRREQLYEAALGFEQLLLQQLTPGAPDDSTDGTDGSDRRDSSDDGRRRLRRDGSSTSSMLMPDAARRRSPRASPRPAASASPTSSTTRLAPQAGIATPARPRDARSERARRAPRGAGRVAPAAARRSCSPRPRRSGAGRPDGARALGRRPGRDGRAARSSSSSATRPASTPLHVPASPAEHGRPRHARRRCRPSRPRRARALSARAARPARARSRRSTARTAS